MFVGREYYKHTDILTSLLSERTFQKKASKKWIKPFLRLYLRIFGIPDMGIQLRTRYFRKAVAEIKFTKALDAGCGIGINAFFLAKKNPSKIIDACDKRIELVKGAKIIRDSLNLKNVNIYQNDLTQISDEKKYDLIFCIDVIEHIQDDFQVLKNFGKACMDGGKIIVSTPCKNAKRLRVKGLRYNSPGHVRDGYSETELCCLLEMASFQVKEVRNAYGFLAEYCGYLYLWILLHLPSPFAAISFPVLTIISSLDILSKVFHRYGLIVIAQKKN